MSALALEADELAVVINDTDPQSLDVGRYYINARKIPVENIIQVSFHADSPNLDSETFVRIRKQIRASTLPRIKAYAVTWTEPYRVGCMSITSALTLGLVAEHCIKGCDVTPKSPYFVGSPKAEKGKSILPVSMMLAGMNERNVRALIDRGVTSDYSQPVGGAYLLQTQDRKRNVRARAYKAAFKQYGFPNINTYFVERNYITLQYDILFYFVGAKTVPLLGRNRFLPGAVADHLTSAGGMLTDSYQMSALRWLEAGATASYGTVVEPCNRLAKFPNPIILMEAVVAGDSLVTAYWKSVEMPSEGVFVGEPLAKPFARNTFVTPLK